MEPEDVTLQLLEEITDCFSENRKLGRGAFGVVYRGLTKNGEDVAVKKLRDNVTDLNNKQFQNEFDNLKKLKHQNIVRLYGYCYDIRKKHMEHNGRKVLVEEPHRALCLEYLHNGSLQKHLSDEFSGLDWSTRYKIIKGTCEGLKHIHEELEEPLYHLDLKPDNILLDNNMVPKLADFGLSRIFGHKELPRTTQSPLGTPRYQPPEYIERGEISKKFDIFSLGVIMIQIVSGPDGYFKCTKMPSKEFIDLIKMNWRNRLQKTCGGSSLEAYCHQVETCTRIALNCVENDTQKRPDIVNVVHELNQIEFDSGKHPHNLMMHENMNTQMELHDTTDQIHHLNLMTSPSCSEVDFVDIREKASGVGEEFIIGRTKEKREIIASLLQSMTQQIIILPIYGIGGIGKTTFAKLIYNDTNFNHYFRVWVYVSPSFDLNKVGNSIISQLPGEESEINETKKVHSLLLKLFSGRKILIVLDDLWEDNLFQLDSLKDMLSPGHSINVIVLVTTRSKHVADNISINAKPHWIEPLTNDLCWDIIKQKSGFETRDDKEQLTDIGRDIALKCRGVALAAQSLGFMLRPMKPDEWMKVRDNEIWNESISEDATLPNHVLASLKLSCTKMAPCLMSCFTYCGIFPKGHLILKENLIYQWISLGFIKPTKLHSSMQICEKYIVQLLGLSFLQHQESSMIYGLYRKGFTLFTMHDLVHDLARLLIGDKILDASDTAAHEYRYALLADGGKPQKSLTDPSVMIRALHLGGLDARLEDDAFLPGKSLQVLDLKWRFGFLPASISELVHLKYLNAPRITNKMLPDSFTKLSDLIYLNLSGSYISSLPDSIGEIKGLMHLDMSGCGATSELPESFANLKNLVHLDLSHSHIKITAKTFGAPTNIQHLNLSHTGSDGFEGLQEVITSLTELRYLGLSGCLRTPISDEILSFVDRICTLSNLVDLDLSYNDCLVRVPGSIGNLRKLHTLDFSWCQHLETLPECMLEMDSLKVLNVNGCHSLDESTLPVSKHLVLLPHFAVRADDGEPSSNIGLLRHVAPYELHVSGLENVMSSEEAHSIKLSEKLEMKRLALEWTTRDARRYVGDMQVLGKLVPPETLNLFGLKGYHSVNFPTWTMGINHYLPRLTKIVLWELRNCNRLPPLGRLTTLRKLVMGGMDSITTIGEDFCYARLGGSVVLTKFYLYQMENLELWNTTVSHGLDGDVHGFMFPNLEKLIIVDCPKLRLRPCPPKTLEWSIENSDNVLSQWDDEGQINLTSLLPDYDYTQFENYFTTRPAGPGASNCAWPKLLEVESSKVPLDQWRLFQHLLPTYYDLTISAEGCYTFNACGSSVKENIRNFCAIKSLSLEDNTQSELPKWLGHLSSLQTLWITKYPGLEAPLERMKRLTHLRELLLTDCGVMSTLPQWLGELISLQHLSISGWTDLSDFPESMRRLTSLLYLRLDGCPRITALPEWLGDLASLEGLCITDCVGIESLPESIRNLTNLQRLAIRGSGKLELWCDLVENNSKLAHIEYKDINGSVHEVSEEGIDDADNFS